MSNFDYSSLVWMFSNATSLKKTENLQKTFLQRNLNKLQKTTKKCLYNDYELSYEQLLDKVSNCTMNIKRLHILCVKSINN